MKLSGFSYTQAALDAFEKLPKKSRRQIKSKIDGLVGGTIARGVKVRGIDANIYRIRSGDYRILYTVRGSSHVIILDIGHRKDIYRRMN